MASQRGHLYSYGYVLPLLFLVGTVFLRINVQAKEELNQSTSLDSVICTPDVPGMVGYWPMDEGPNAPPFLDAINPGLHDATCLEGKCPDSTTGKLGGAFHFERILDELGAPIGGDEVNAPGFDELNWVADSSFSIETWVNVPTTLTCETLETRKVFVGRRSGGVSVWLGCALGDKAVFSVRDSEWNQSTATSESPINDGLWHHIVGVRNGTTGETLVYVDGVASTPDTITFTGTFSANAKLNFGWFNVDPYYWLTGTLDEIAVYNRAITAEEINGHYADGQGQSYCDNAPVIDPIATQISDEGDTALVTVTAQDLEGHDFTLSATGFPPGIVFDPVSGQFSGTISYLAYVGSTPYNVTVTAQETMPGGMTGTLTFDWTVNDVNRPPVVTNPGTQSSDEGQTITLQIAASDPDIDNTLSFSAENLPAGLSIDPLSGLISGTISFLASGNSPYTVEVTVTDDAPEPMNDSISFIWNVADTNLQVYLPFVVEGSQP